MTPAELQHKRTWVAKNADHVRAYQLAYRQKNRDRLLQNAAKKRTAAPKRVHKPLTAEQAAKRADYQREYSKKNADRLLARRRLYLEKNSESVKAKKAAYVAQNPHQLVANTAKRRALVAKATGSFTKGDVDAVLESQRFICVVCHGKLGRSYEVDHINPISRGGSNDKTNIQILCMPCNRSKGAKDPVSFMQSRGFLL